MLTGRNQVIRRLESERDLEQCVDLQSLVWGLSDEETVSAPVLAVCSRHQALILGSFEGDLLTGFCFSLPSLFRGVPSHHSHMLAVRPEYRDQGIGRTLKTAQFEALKAEVGWITWTFDPLESRNARLNLKLGVSIGTYIRDLYGDGASCLLHRDIGTDRFLAEWPTSLSREKQPVTVPAAGTPGTAILASAWDPRGYYRPLAVYSDLGGASLLLEIPADIQRIKQSDPACARAWREMTRKAAEHYFSRGYRIHRFHTYMQKRPESRRSFYILEALQPDA